MALSTEPPPGCRGVGWEWLFFGAVFAEEVDGGGVASISGGLDETNNRLPAVAVRGGVLDQDYTKLSAAVCRRDYLASKRRLVV